MTFSKRGAVIGAILAALCAALVIHEKEDFLSLGLSGSTLFYVALTLAILIFPAAAIFPKRFDAHPAGTLTDAPPPSKERLLYRLWRLAVFFLAPMAAVAAVERLNGNFLYDLNRTGGYFWTDNYCVALLFYLLLFAVTGSVRASVFVTSPVLLLFGIANMYVREFKGSPLLPMDFRSASTAATVASHFKYTVGCEIAYAVTLTVLYLALASHFGRLPRKKRQGTPKWRRPVQRFLALAAVTAVCFLFYGTDVLVDYGYRPDFFNQSRGYSQCGATLEFMVNTRYLHLSAPDGYDPEKVESLLEETLAEGETPDIAAAGLGKNAAQVDAPEETPDIIVIMDEAFSDLRLLGDFRTDKETMPFLDSLTENTIHMDTCVSVIGTGTSNTEFEYLTGNSMAFLTAGSNAYQLYVGDRQPGAVRTLESLGYGSATFHPYFRSNWNRPAVYRSMGFDSYRSLDQMIDRDIYNKYIENVDDEVTFSRLLEERYGRTDILMRQYISDKYDFEEVIRLYEARDKSEPFFLFNVTMQNHSPYDKVYANFRNTVSVQDMPAPCPRADQYLSLVRETDRQLEALIEYFAKVDKPVLLVFFGDHQPYVDEAFYETVMGKPVNDLSAEEAQRRYISKGIIWANYDIPEGDLGEISVNYLSTLTSQLAGLPLTKYQQYLAHLYTKVPVVTAQGCFDTEGHFFEAGGDSPYADLLNGYACLEYNNLIDAEHRAEALFGLEETAADG